MQRLKLALSCALLAAATGLLVQAILLLHAATFAARALPVAVSTELQAARTELTGQIEDARKDVLLRSERQVAALRTDLMAKVSEVSGLADRRIGDTLARVDTALGTADALRADLQPALTNAASITGHVNSITAHVDDALPQFTDCAYLDADGTPVGGNPDCAFNRFQGMSKAFETASLDVSTMTRDFRGAIPGVLADVKRAADGSARASESTAQVMANFARATKPLPTWARIGLAVAPPLAQVAMSVATTLAVTGQVGK